MELIVRKFEKINDAFARVLNTKDNEIIDIVIAAELGFAYEVNNRLFFYSHLFCFHYCIDVYQGDKNISFNILNPNDQTGDYCFWKYGQNFHKEDLKSRKIEVDNSSIVVPKVDVSFQIDDKEPFDSIVDKIKTDLWNTHTKVLNKFEEIGINYDLKEMKQFSKNLKHFIEEGYSSIRQSEMQNFIKEYDVLSLSHNLPQKNINTKKLKI